MESFFALVGLGFGTLVSAGILVVILWSIFWKGWALWVASKENSKLWFFVLLIVNTFGILEIIYIFVFSKNKKDNSPYKGIFSRKNIVKNEGEGENIKEAEVEKKDTGTHEEPNS